MSCTTTPPKATDGSTLSFRGIDNAAYYRLVPDDPVTTWISRGRQHSQPQHPVYCSLLMDSLRYWVLEMHVDGFRFDLASRCRELFDVDVWVFLRHHCQTRPVAGELIAEPWDIGSGGYQVGNFPPAE